MIMAKFAVATLDRPPRAGASPHARRRLANFSQQHLGPSAQTLRAGKIDTLTKRSQSRVISWRTWTYGAHCQVCTGTASGGHNRRPVGRLGAERARPAAARARGIGTLTKRSQSRLKLIEVTTYRDKSTLLQELGSARAADSATLPAQQSSTAHQGVRNSRLGV
ncbi:MAG: hypothetical protein KGM43_17680 [Planctomycetota bacterium]|nr:hypothetical protein [Planctomycetota bacterium]